MKWLETIKLQTAIGLENSIENKLSGLLADALQSQVKFGLVDGSLYNHASINGCYIMHLMWDNSVPDLLGSPAGMQITHALKTFGLVDHAVWISKG